MIDMPKLLAIRKISQYIAIISLVLFLLLISYSGYQLHVINKETAQAAAALTAKNEEVIEKDKLLKEMEEKIKVKEMIVKQIDLLLEEFGWTKAQLADRQFLIIDSLKANNELQRVSSANEERRRGITIRYYSKRSDISNSVNKVVEALKGLEFQVEVRDPDVPGNATNTIVFGSNVSPEDAKLVAYALMRAGVEIKAIYKASGRDKPPIGLNEIQILGDRAMERQKSLTVEEVRTSIEFPTHPQS
jgi:hypothetical protein